MSEIFQKPVFRLFLTEIDAVIEEFNLHKSNPYNQIWSKYDSIFYLEHKLASDVIGSMHDVSYPSLIKMENFFKTYYVPQNTVLVIAGNFAAEQAAALVEKSFQNWENSTLWLEKQAPKSHPKPIEPNYNSFISSVPNAKNTTFMVGFGVQAHDASTHANIELLDYILSNNSKTGIIDQWFGGSEFQHLAFHHSIFDSFYQCTFMLIPEKKINILRGLLFIKEMLSYISKADFASEFECLKQAFIRAEKLSFESSGQRKSLITGAFANRLPIAFFVEQLKIIEDTDFYTFSNFINDYFLKSNYVDVTFTPNNQSAGTIANKFDIEINKNKHTLGEKTSVEKYKTNFNTRKIDFPSDFISEKISPNITFLYKENTYKNEIFSLDLLYKKGEIEFNSISLFTNKCVYDWNNYQESHTLGCKFSYLIDYNQSMFQLSAIGHESDLKSWIDHQKKLLELHFSQLGRSNFHYKNAKLEMKAIGEIPSELSNALDDYIIWGKQSKYYYGTKKDYKKYNTLALYQDGVALKNSPLTIMYNGSSPYEVVVEAIKSLNITQKATESSIHQPAKYNEKTFYFVENKSKQSYVSMYQHTGKYDEKKSILLTLWSEMLANGNNSLLFNSMREEKGLVYYVDCKYYAYDDTLRDTYLQVNFSCQNNNVKKSMEIFEDIYLNIDNISLDFFESKKEQYIQKLKVSYPENRSFLYTIDQYLSLGYTQDPRTHWISWLETVELSDFKHFCKEIIATSPLIYGVCGQSDGAKGHKGGDFGKVVKVSQKDIFTGKIK